ncbi:hypothetical protein PHSY_006180 [Pseudozyma hubeiensis SY62]|uniref:Uncharacterized protein n=1 Tax=Pseudozyma hubeiensis (strain SY62) TaxID=1305764 RepID=R9PB32_PSEHS|nr:hypothetical protein PHSY_006180 [Pseudozyma hubeiensis SY62]GAC98586.1 hypothetical protein PHSY_006180 [Pseudozyma hubeiensis SY62]
MVQFLSLPPPTLLSAKIRQRPFRRRSDSELDRCNGTFLAGVAPRNARSRDRRVEECWSLFWEECTYATQAQDSYACCVSRAASGMLCNRSGGDELEGMQNRCHASRRPETTALKSEKFSLQ